MFFWLCSHNTVTTGQTHSKQCSPPRKSHLALKSYLPLFATVHVSGRTTHLVAYLFSTNQLIEMCLMHISFLFSCDILKVCFTFTWRLDGNRQTGAHSTEALMVPCRVVMLIFSASELCVCIAMFLGVCVSFLKKKLKLQTSKFFICFYFCHVRRKASDTRMLQMLRITSEFLLSKDQDSLWPPVSLNTSNKSHHWLARNLWECGLFQSFGSDLFSHQQFRIIKT